MANKAPMLKQGVATVGAGLEHGVPNAIGRAVNSNVQWVKYGFGNHFTLVTATTPKAEFSTSASAPTQFMECPETGGPEPVMAFAAEVL